MLQIKLERETNILISLECKTFQASLLSNYFTTKTLVDVALQIGRSTYSYYETGRRIPDLETLLLIAQYYHISLDELVSSYCPPEKFKKEKDNGSEEILLTRHLKSKHIPTDFIMELSKSDFDFLKDYKKFSDDYQAELQIKDSNAQQIVSRLSKAKEQSKQPIVIVGND